MCNALIHTLLHILQMPLFVCLEAVVFVASCFFLVGYLFQRRGR